MAKRGRDDVETYESDDGFVENDGNAPKTKKTKKTKMAQAAQRGQANDNKFWELSSGKTPRRVEISEFKNAKLINIREFYEKDGEYLPGKKGISLSVDQYKAFLKAIPALNAQLKDLGVDLGVSLAVQDDSETEGKPQSRQKAKKEEKGKKERKSNIEATSDEDGE